GSVHSTPEQQTGLRDLIRLPMKYLLDVNGLVALGFLQHEFLARVATWVHTLASRGVPELATCSITDLGFVRVLAQAPDNGFTIGDARTLLLHLKEGNTL